MPKFDLTIIGGGIVGFATARQVSLKHPKLRLCVLEKEKELATHQSMRNSGVVHCGIYYKKNSLKSNFCIKGAKLIKDYCLSKNLLYNQCGKLIVATKEDELERLHHVFQNAQANNIEGIEMYTASQVLNVQPGCTKSLEAIWSPNTAIVNWQKVALSFANDFSQNNGTIITGFSAYKFISQDNGSLKIEDAVSGKTIETKSVINCAGVYSDYFLRQTGNNEHPKVVPFKGNYYQLSDRLANSIKTNVYPVPDPKLPFLGVHITPKVDGTVLIGPTALLTLGFEKYDDSVPLRLIHMYHILYRSGARKMLKNKDYRKAGFLELYRFLSKKRFTEEVRELLPDIKEEDLIDINFCGIRAQLVQRDGELVDDFLFESGLLPEYNRVLHLRNCPSPAATSSLAIAERVVNILEERLI